MFTDRTARKERAMPGRDRDHWDDEEEAQERYAGRSEDRDRYERETRPRHEPYYGERSFNAAPRIGPTGMMNHSTTGNWGTSGRYFEDEAGRAEYGGWGGSQPTYGARHRPQRRDAYPDPGHRPDYRIERGYTREDQEAIGGPYTDYGHAMGGYGAGGGYTPTPDEGVGRDHRAWAERRSWAERHEPGSWFGRAPGQRRYDEGPHRGRGPKGYTRSGERIREDVSDRLTDDPRLDASDIEVAVDGTEVTLNGTVDSRTAKRRAEDHADDITGVTHVQNNLRIRPRPGTVAAESDPRLLAIAEGRDAGKAAREVAEEDRSAHPPR